MACGLLHATQQPEPYPSRATGPAGLAWTEKHRRAGEPKHEAALGPLILTVRLTGGLISGRDVLAARDQPPGSGCESWMAAGVLPQATVSSMMPTTFPAGMASTTMPIHVHSSHQACAMIAAPPVMNAAITTATSTHDAALPCGWPPSGTCRCSTCSQGRPPCPVEISPVGPLPLISPRRRSFRRRVSGGASAQKTRPSHAARPTMAATAVRIIPVVVPSSSGFDVLTSGGGYISAHFLVDARPARKPHYAWNLRRSLRMQRAVLARQESARLICERTSHGGLGIEETPRSPRLSRARDVSGAQLPRLGGSRGTAQGRHAPARWRPCPRAR